jgi:phenylacetate-coenzyme A ligase PaaK-like adenylate-forming protein
VATDKARVRRIFIGSSSGSTGNRGWVTQK